MIAYLLPGVHPADALDDPRLSRLRRAWPKWEALPHTEGTLLVPRGTRPTIAAWTDTDDGLRYGRPTSLPTIGDLARSTCPPSIPVDLCCGHQVSVALGAASPRQIHLASGGAKFGDHSTQLGILAHQIRQRSVSGEIVPDEEVAWLIFLAIQACYHITEELATDMGLITTGDLTPCLLAVWGGDPKAVSGDGHTSSPQPPASSHSPTSPRLNSTPSPPTTKNASP